MNPFSYTSYLFFLLLSPINLVQSAPHPAEIVERDQVGACLDLLILLKASAFCSSAIGLHDVTSTLTSTGSTIHKITTVPASSCTQTVSASTTTETSFITLSPSTITSIVTSIPPESTETDTSYQTSTYTATTITTYALAPPPKQRRAPAPTCNIKNLPLAIEIFACDIINAACSQFVHPHTSTTHITVPGATYTSTSTASPQCATFTPPESSATTYISITPSASTTVTTVIEPALTTTTKTTTTASAAATDFVQGSTTFTNDCYPSIEDTPVADAPPGITVTRDVRCNTNGGFPESFVTSTTTQSFSGCISACDNTACDSVSWNIATGECAMYDGAVGNTRTDYGFNYMQYDFS